MILKNRSFFFVCFSFVFSLFLFPVDVMDIDAAQFAEVAREMIKNNDYLYLRDNGRKFLDKAIWGLWQYALGFKILGINNYGYRLMPFLNSILLGFIIYNTTFLISKNKEKSYFSVFVFFTSPAFLFMILDPKIDIYLSVFLTSTYFFYLKGKESGNSIYYYLMYLSISLGIITKGPIGIVIPGIGIAGSIILQRDWKRIYEMKPWIGILIVPIFPIFWSWILYQEYSSYGPYFFLWFQSFGRFYEKLYDMGRDPVFFISNFSWGFFPYLFIGVYLVAIHGKKWIKEHVFSKNPSKSEISIHLWFFVFFGLMLFSKYKLPQYIFWTIPAASILIGLNIPERIHGYTKALLIIPAILLFFVQIVSLYAIVGFDFLGMIISIIALSSLYFLRNSKFLSGSVMALIFLSTSLIFLPNLIVYQPSHELGKRVMELESNQEQLYTFRISVSQRSYAFYSNRFTRGIYNMEKFDEELNYSGKRLVVVPEKYLGEMKKFLGSNYEVQIINSYAYYKVSMPKLEFFDRTKRDSLTEKILLTWVKRSSGNSHSKRKLK